MSLPTSRLTPTTSHSYGSRSISKSLHIQVDSPEACVGHPRCFHTRKYSARHSHYLQYHPLLANKLLVVHLLEDQLLASPPLP